MYLEDFEESMNKSKKKKLLIFFILFSLVVIIIIIIVINWDTIIDKIKGGLDITSPSDDGSGGGGGGGNQRDPNFNDYSGNRSEVCNNGLPCSAYEKYTENMGIIMDDSEWPRCNTYNGDGMCNYQESIKYDQLSDDEQNLYDINQALGIDSDFAMGGSMQDGFRSLNKNINSDKIVCGNYWADDIFSIPESEKECTYERCCNTVDTVKTCANINGDSTDVIYPCSDSGKVNKDESHRIICDSSWLDPDVDDRKWEGINQIRGYEGYQAGWNYSLDSLWDMCTEERCCKDS